MITSDFTVIIVNERIGMPMALKALLQPKVRFPKAYENGTIQKKSVAILMTSGSLVKISAIGRAKIPMMIQAASDHI